MKPPGSQALSSQAAGDGADELARGEARWVRERGDAGEVAGHLTERREITKPAPKSDKHGSLVQLYWELCAFSYTRSASR